MAEAVVLDAGYYILCDETSRLLLQDEDMTLIGYVVHDDMRIVVDLLNNQDDEDDEDDKDKEDEDYNEEDDGN
ncbi:hypothetical protein LINPERPRIM_LOCUS40602 [Linum perenne]